MAELYREERLGDENFFSFWNEKKLHEFISEFHFHEHLISQTFD